MYHVPTLLHGPTTLSFTDCCQFSLAAASCHADRTLGKFCPSCVDRIWILAAWNLACSLPANNVSVRNGTNGCLLNLSVSVVIAWNLEHSTRDIFPHIFTVNTQQGVAIVIVIVVVCIAGLLDCLLHCFIASLLA